MRAQHFMEASNIPTSTNLLSEDYRCRPSKRTPANPSTPPALLVESALAGRRGSSVRTKPITCETLIRPDDVDVVVFVDDMLHIQSAEYGARRESERQLHKWLIWL
ncbi:unnamed protein product [Heligmosomoides polygyrus]|uniref:Reverse transcriptase domain-containing protein n=1 Tax=Heligmosomoides polygyrus TaxID=6339 RepID=A0A183FFP1_HELPZ|nr:unnamed protein product [Heligmosomoides polygyrus]